MGLFSQLAGLATANAQAKLAKKIHPVDTTYADAVRGGGENPYIQSLYGEGRNLYQGRMAGAGAEEQNILTNQANTLSTVQDNATDASQVLAIGAGLQGKTDAALSNLGSKESMDKVRRFGIFSNVSELMAQEGDKIYQDKLRKYYDDLNYKRALQGASLQTLMGGASDFDKNIEQAAGFASGGGYFGGGGSGNGRGQRSGQNQIRQPYYGYNPRTGGYYTD